MATSNTCNVHVKCNKYTYNTIKIQFNIIFKFSMKQYIIGNVLFNVSDFHKHCYGNLTVLGQYDHLNFSLTQISFNQINSRNSQNQNTFKTKVDPRIEEEHSIETNESQHGSQKRTRDSQHFLKQVMSGYQFNKESIQGSVENRNANENTIGLKDNVRFFRRNNYWKPKRIYFNSRNYPNEQNIKPFKIGYDQPFKTHDNVQNQGQVFSGCCTVMSNTISIRNSGSKHVHNFNAPDYLPPIDKTTSKATEYLPPNTEMNVPNVKSTTVSRPAERGDIPEEDDFTTISPVIAMLVPPEYDEVAEEPPDTAVPTISSSRVTIPTTYTSESSNILMEEKSLSTTTPSIKEVKYLPPENTETKDPARPKPQFPGPEPAMAMPVPPEPDDNDTLPTPTSTTATTRIPDHPQTEQSHPPSSFTGPEYLPPKDTSPASMPVPEPNCNFGSNEPIIDPRSSAADPCQSTEKPNEAASNENLNKF